MRVQMVFIILHYGDKSLTDRAISSLMNLQDIEKSRIIIVDNGSPNGSGRELTKAYANSSIVEVILLENNLGFSKGNNKGYAYAKEQYNADFFIFMNNDIIIHDRHFIEKIYTEYRRVTFYVAGPDVYVPQIMYHSSPLRRERISSVELENEIERNRVLIQECEKSNSKFLKRKYNKEIRFGNNPFRYCLIAIKRLLLGERQVKWREDQGNYFVLQGSFLIVDKRFIVSCDKAFAPETFLYAEEYILSARCRKNGWNIRYLPTVCVYHTCQGSLKAQEPGYKEYCDKMKRSAEYSIQALEIYKQYDETEENVKL